MGNGASVTNCTASCGLCVFVCCEKCKVDDIRNRFTMQPPSPSSYALINGGRVMEFQIPELAKHPLYQMAREKTAVVHLEHAMGKTIGVYMTSAKPRYANPQSPIVILHLHGNATDCGRMLVSYMELAENLGVDVFGVEYLGYGAFGEYGSTPTATFRSLDYDSAAAYDYLVKERKIPHENIIVYGQSIGTGPSLKLITIQKRPAGGLVMHSPMLSGIRILDPEPDTVCCRPSCVFRNFDLFRNHSKIGKLPGDTPAFIVHGQQDEVVPFYHGEQLARMAQGSMSYFPKEAGHNDIVEYDPEAYFTKMSEFLATSLRTSVYKPMQGGFPDISPAALRDKSSLDIIGMQNIEKTSSGSKASASNARPQQVMDYDDTKKPLYVGVVSHTITHGKEDTRLNELQLTEKKH